MKQLLTLTATALLATGLLQTTTLAQTPAPAPTPAVATPASPVPSPPTVPTSGYILIDYDSGRVLASQRPDDRMEPASITKLMTGYIVFEALRDKRLTLAEEVPVSENAWRKGGAASGGSTTFLEVHSRVPVEVLIKGMIVQSGNDATIALAERLGGTEQGFAQIMNEYARRLQMKGTNFVNSWGGPDPQHYTTARDLATLSAAIIRDYPEYYRWYSMREFTWNKHTQPNRNGLLYRDSSVDGIKTGHTESAKYCLVSSAKRGDMRLIAVVLGSPTVRAREDASAALLNYGFTFFETVQAVEGRKPLLKPRIFKGEEEFVGVGTASTVYVTVPRGEGAKLSKVATVDPLLTAPLARGTRVGQYEIRSGDSAVQRIPLVTLEEAKEGGLWRQYSDAVRLWFE
jgi:D-alanyl-D-alanine carboxypeptidase (penicillin-binding protein 5/6)